MMYLPPKDGQPDLVKLFVEMFGLVMPEKIAEEVVKKDVKLIFDPVTKELIQIIMPFLTKTEVMTLTVDKGWVTEASRRGRETASRCARDDFRLQGGEWVAREIVKDVQSGRAKFVVNSGDVVWWGNQGRTVNDSPYWKRVNDTQLKPLPPADSEMRAAGLEGRWFIGVGNHEVWGDPKIEGVLNAVPYLKKLGVTPDNLIYKFDFKGARFIFLWTGKYDYRSPSQWDGDRPKFAEQMRRMSAVAGRGQGQGHTQGFHHLPLPGVRPVGPGPHPRPRQSAQGDCGPCEGHGGGRVQWARPHHRDVRSRRREIPDAGRWRRRTGPDSPRPCEHQGTSELPAGSYWKGQPPKEGVQLRPRGRKTRREDEVHAECASGRGRPRRLAPWSYSSE